ILRLRPGARLGGLGLGLFLLRLLLGLGGRLLVEDVGEQRVEGLIVFLFLLFCVLFLLLFLGFLLFLFLFLLLLLLFLLILFFLLLGLRIRDHLGDLGLGLGLRGGRWRR